MSGGNESSSRLPPSNSLRIILALQKILLKRNDRDISVSSPVSLHFISLVFFRCALAVDMLPSDAADKTDDAMQVNAEEEGVWGRLGYMNARVSFIATV
jgi:hypothetical protein